MALVKLTKNQMEYFRTRVHDIKQTAISDVVKKISEDKLTEADKAVTYSCGNGRREISINSDCTGFDFRALGHIADMVWRREFWERVAKGSITTKDSQVVAKYFKTIEANKGRVLKITKINKSIDKVVGKIDVLATKALDNITLNQVDMKDGINPLVEILADLNDDVQRIVRGI